MRFQLSPLMIVITTASFAYSGPVGHSISAPNIVATPFNNLQDITHKKIALVINPKKGFIGAFPDSGRKRAVLEQESLISQKDTLYGRLQEFVAGFYHPQPIVDTIQEYKKYGNDGGQIRYAASSLIVGYEALSNILNAAIDIPFETVKQVTNKLSNTATSVGAKLSGL